MISTGDQVKLKSGGPTMTVDSFTTEIGGIGGTAKKDHIRCSWFDGGKLRSGIFPNESLVSADKATIIKIEMVDSEKE